MPEPSTPSPEQVGPPQEPEPWESWTPEEHADAKQIIQHLDGIKFYRTPAGSLGHGAEHAEASRRLAERGGLTHEEATHLARYRMFLNGSKNIPRGPRQPTQTDEDKQALQKRYFETANDPKARAQLIDEGKSKDEQSLEGFYDSLITPKPLPPESKANLKVTLAKYQGAKEPETDDQRLADMHLLMLLNLLK